MRRIEDARDLKPGDVLVIDVTLTDRVTGQDRIWRRYACVLERALNLWVVPVSVAGGYSKYHFTAMTLKMQIDEKKDIREINLREERERCYLLPEDKWPQGVIAMRMKWIAKGVIKLGGG